LILLHDLQPNRKQRPSRGCSQTLRGSGIKEFRIVGGTAVALHFGHRISVDIDFFTGRKVNKKQTATLLMDKFPGSEAYVMQYGVRSEIQGSK